MKKFNRVLSVVLALLLIIGMVPMTALATEVEAAVEKPTAEIDDLKNDEFTYGLTFTANEVSEETKETYGGWYADFVLSANKELTLSADGSYIAGQYDTNGEEWIALPAEGEITVTPDAPVYIMQYVMEQVGMDSKLTYNDVLNFVKVFNCGAYIEPEFLALNPDLELTLSLVIYNEEEEYEIDKRKFTAGLPKAKVEPLKGTDYTYALTFTAPEAAEAKKDVYGDWYADFTLTANKDITLSADGSYIAGQYDTNGEEWIALPAEGTISLSKDEPLPIMQYVMEQVGMDSKLTYNDVLNFVKVFNCGAFIDAKFLAENPDLELTLALVIDNGEGVSYTLGTEEFEGVELPTATVEALKNEDLTYGLTFIADEATDEQKAAYGAWETDFVLNINKDVTFNADGTADGILTGQYDAYSEEWINIPVKDTTFKANEDVKIMQYVAELLELEGFITYNDVVNFVKTFNCGVLFSDKFLAKNPDLHVTLSLIMYAPDGTEYVIETEEFDAPAAPAFPTATVTDLEGTEHTFAVTFTADEVTDKQRAYYGDWYADFTLELNTDLALTKDGSYISGQYDVNGDEWVTLSGIELKKDTALPIMQYVMEQVGMDSKLTYNDVLNFVKVFNCGLKLSDKDLKANQNVVATLALVLTDPDNENNKHTVVTEYFRYAAPVVSTPVDKEVVVETVTPEAVPEEKKEEVKQQTTAKVEEVKQEVIENVEIFAPEFEVEDVKNTATELPEDKIEDETVTVVSTIAISLENVKVEATYDEEEDKVVVVPAKITYDVTPQIIVTETVEGEEEKVDIIEIKKFNEPITFRLPVPSGIKAEHALVYHEGDELGIHLIQGNDPHRYVEITSDEFSEYAIEFLTEDTPVEPVAMNATTGTEFTTVEAALAAAKAGQTVVLLKDTKVSTAFLPIYAGITLQLAGSTLDVDGNHVAAYGDIKNGTLKGVNPQKFIAGNGMTQLPVKTAEGTYTFVDVSFKKVYNAAQGKYGFQINGLDRNVQILNLLKTDASAAGVTIGVDVSWKQTNGQRTQGFVYNDEFVTEYLTKRYSNASGAANTVFALTMGSTEGFEELTFAGNIKSADLNVTLHAEALMA